jgi:hypothetical protein
MFDLGKIEKSHYLPFIIDHFKRGAIRIEPKEVEEILDWTKRHTYYTQYFCHRLFEAQTKIIKSEQIEQMKFKILKENEMLFYNYPKLLSHQQWKLIKAIGVEGEVYEPTSSGFIHPHQLGAHSTVRLSLIKLMEKEMIYEQFDLEKEKSYYQVYDVFLEKWIQAKYLKNGRLLT